MITFKQWLTELDQSTLKSYKEKASKDVDELTQHAADGEYKDIAKNIKARREKGLANAEKKIK